MLAGTMAISVRTTDMVSNAAIISHGRSGLTNKLPRLRDHISSKNEIETPSWPRNIRSHSITPARSTPMACATKLD